MYKILFFFLFFFAISSWAVCYENQYNPPGNLACYLNDSFCSCTDGMYAYNAFWIGCTQSNGRCYCTGNCENKSSSDSLVCVRNGGLWENGTCCNAECRCKREGGQWVNGKCQNCNEHTNDQTKCDMTWNTGYSTDATGEPGGGGYWQINLYECYYDSCAMSLNCTLKSHFPAGSLTCDDFNDGCHGGDCGRCIAVIGSQCTIQCPNNVTINCACDGSCDHAKTLTACRCPEQSSSSGGGSSSSGGGSSSSGGGSSSSMSSSSAQSSSSELPRSSSSHH